MRMAAIADNLANVSSPNFRSAKVDFEQALQAAARRGSDAVAELKFEFEAGQVLPAGEDRRMDLMLADAAQTAGRYAALVDMLGRRFALHQAAMGGQG
jgi:flagellar basal-body rod protein FlgB